MRFASFAPMFRRAAKERRKKVATAVRGILVRGITGMRIIRKLCVG